MIMKCKHCSEEISRVVVISECVQTVDIDENGEVDICSWSSVDDIGPALRVLCPSCDGELDGIDV